MSFKDVFEELERKQAEEEKNAVYEYSLSEEQPHKNLSRYYIQKTRVLKENEESKEESEKISVGVAIKENCEGVDWINLPDPLALKMKLRFDQNDQMNDPFRCLKETLAK